MNKPKVYFVNGTAVADKGQHVFKDTICLYGHDIEKLRAISDVKELPVGVDGVYYLTDEGIDIDYGERYLIAAEGITAFGKEGEEGSISAALSPIIAYNEYIKEIDAIKGIMEDLTVDNEPSRLLLRLLFVGVCGEMEGYVASTLISLIQGVRDFYLECKKLKDFNGETRKGIIDMINNSQGIQSRKNPIRLTYEKLLVPDFKISPLLREYTDWRNKLAHRVVFYEKPKYPTREDVLGFIAQTDELVNIIDTAISQYKTHWFDLDAIMR